MKTKDAIQISAATHPNGYSLTVNGESFMYFSAIDWLAGVLAHVGMGETSMMEKGTILSSLFSAMMGDAYADAVTTLKQRVGLLTSQYNTTIGRMDKAIDYVTKAEKQIESFLRRLDAIDAQLHETELDHANSKKMVNEVKWSVNSLNKQVQNLAVRLGNSEAIMQAMDEVKSKKKKKADEGQEVPEKSGDADGKSAKPADDGKPKGKGGRNKAADAQVMKALKKKSKENPDIK